MSIIKKNYLWILVSVLMMLTSLFFVGCGANDPYSNISLTASSQSMSLYIGQTVEYEYTIENYIENMDNAVHFTIIDASASSGSTSSEDDEEIFGEHISLQVISANRNKIKVAITGISSGRSSILATTEEGFKKCVVDISVLQFSKTFEVDNTKTMYIALNQKIYVSNEYFLFDEGTTERTVRYFDVQDEDEDREGKEFVSLYFYENEGVKYLSFFDKDGDAIATKTCTYDGQYFTFLASYSYKETDELGNEVEVSINKLTQIIALYGINQEDVQIYDDIDKVLQEDADGLLCVDKDTINVELIANKADSNFVTYFVTVPTITDSLIDFVFSYSYQDKTVVNIEAQNITNDPTVAGIKPALDDENLLLYKIILKTDSFTSSQQTKVFLNVHYAFEQGASFENVYDESVNYTVEVPVIIKLMPEKVEVVDKNKVVLTNNNLGAAGNSEQEIYYNYYVSEYGWIEYYINVYKPSATYSGVKVTFDYTQVNIIYDGKTFNSTISFIMTDLSKPIYIRGVEGVVAGVNGTVVFDVQSELFEAGMSLNATLNYTIQDGASKITYNTPSFDAKTGNGIYISTSSTENTFVDLYADKQFKYFVVEAINPGIVSIGELEVQNIGGTYYLSMVISPIKVGEANYIVRLDNGVSTTLKVKVVNTFDNLAIALTGVNPDVVSFENDRDLALANGVEDYANLVVRNSGSYGKRASYELLTTYPDSVLNVQEDFDEFGVCSIVPATGLVRQIETISKGTIELTLTVIGRGVVDFELKNDITKEAILNIISFVPVSNVSVHNINPITNTSSSAEKVVVYSQVAQGEEYDENASNTAFLKVEINPSDAYYFYDVENSQYSGTRNTKEYVYWTLSDGVFAFDTENTARRTDMLIYGKSYYISGRTIFNSRNYYGKIEYDESLNYYKFTANPLYASGANFTIYASIRQFGLKKYYAVQIECREFVAVEQIFVTDGIERYSFKSSQKTTYVRATGQFDPKGLYYTTDDEITFERVALPKADEFNDKLYWVPNDKDFQIAEDKLEFAVYLNPYEATVGGVKCLYVTNSGDVDLIDIARDVLVTPLKTTTSKAYLISVIMRPETIDLLTSATTLYAGTLYVVPNDWYNSNYTDLNGVDTSKLAQIISININFQNGTRANPYVLDDYTDVINIGKDSRSRSAHYVVYNLIDMAKCASGSYPICSGTTKFTGSIRGGTAEAGFINVRITTPRGMIGDIEKAGGATEDDYSLDNLIFKGSINLESSAGGTAFYGLVAGNCSGSVYNINVEIDENSTIKLTGAGAGANFNVGLAFGHLSGSIYQDFSRNYIEIGGSLYGSEWCDESGAVVSKDAAGDKFFKIGVTTYKILSEKEIDGVVTPVSPYIIVDGQEYELLHISKIMVFSSKKVNVLTNKAQPSLNVGGVAGTLAGKVVRINNPEMSHYNYSSYTVYAHITTSGTSMHKLGGIAGVFDQGEINNVLIGGHIGYAIEQHSNPGEVIVGGFVGTMLSAGTASLTNSTSRMSVSGYTVGVIVGSINTAGTHTVNNISIQAVDDGKQTGLDMSFVRRYCSAVNAGASTNPDANMGSLSNLLKAGGNKNLDTTVLSGGKLFSYVTTREKISYYTMSGGICSYVDTTEVIQPNQYYGDAILIYIASASSSRIYAAKDFEKTEAGGVEVDIDDEKEFDTTAIGTYSSYVYYFDASAYYNENGELVYSNIITKQDILDRLLNVLRKDETNYFPFSISGESISISSTSSNISIDVNGNITLKNPGVAVIDVTSMLNQKNVVKIYLYIVNYFDVVSYNNMVNNLAGTKTQDLFYIDSLPFRDGTEFSVISEETLNVLLRARMASTIEMGSKDYTVLAGGILLLNGENIILDNSNDFIQYEVDFEGNYVTAKGDFDPSGTYYTYNGLDYDLVATPDIDEFTAGNYFTFEIFGQIDKYEDGFTYVKKPTADTDRDSIDKFDIDAYMSFVADGEEYKFTLANILGITAKYFEGATAIDSNYSTYVIITGKEFKDVFSITSDTDEELMFELQNDKGDVLHENILDDASDALFKASGQKITFEGNPNTFNISLYVNKLSDAFKNRLNENIYGDYYIVAYSTSHGRDGITKTIKLSFEQVEVNTILATSFNDMKAVLDGSGEVESDYVVPKQTGILNISIAPIDADFDYVLIENGQINYQEGSSTASFIAGYLDEAGGTRVFRNLTKVISTPYGIKVTKSTLEQIPNFAGTFYVEYLFGSYRAENESPVRIECSVYKNSSDKPLCEDNLDLKLNVKYEIGLKLNGYENKTRIARGLTYDVEVMNTGYDASSIMISIPADYVETIKLITPDGREVNQISIAEIGKGQICKLKVSNDEINYMSDSNIVKIILEATYIDSLGNTQKESAELELTILEYVINYTFDEENLQDIVSTMENGVVTTAIGEKTTLSIDFNNHSFIEFNDQNEGVWEEIKNFLAELDRKGTWNSYVDVNSSGVQVYKNPIVDKSQAIQDRFGFVDGNALTLENIYFSSRGLSFRAARTHGISEKHYFFSFNARYAIHNGVYVFDPTGSGEQIYTEFTFDAFIRGSEEHPNPVYDYDDLKNMKTGGHYILLQDIYVTDENFEPIATTVASFDGNGYKFIFSNYEENKDGANSIYNLADFNEIGIFSSVGENSVIKNMAIQIGDTHSGDVVFNLPTQSTVSVGLVAVNNRGVITNASVENFDGVNFIVQNNTNSTSIMGAIVASNESTGFLTHSRSYLKYECAFSSGGVLGKNSGVVASSFFKGKILNRIASSTIDIFVGGFAVENSATITTSYAVGDRLDINYTEAVDWTNAESYNIDASVQTAGFVYKNNGEKANIQDCYSNLMISSTSLSAGFVFENNGSIRNAMSYSLIKPTSNRDYGFAGGASTGDFENCYYLRSADFNINKAQDFFSIEGVEIKEIKYSGGIINEFNIKSEADKANFDTFSFSMEENTNFVWEYREELGRLELVDANIIAFSQKDLDRDATIENEDGTTTYFYQTSENSPADGSKENPYVISTPEKFESYLAYGSSVNKHYRIVCDLDFGDYETNYLSTYEKTFEGVLYGNGMKISNVSLYSEESYDYAGLFAQIVGKGTANACVKDLILMPLQVSFVNTEVVGALAGRISYADIVNVSVYGTASIQEEEEPEEGEEEEPDSVEDVCVIVGKNIVGGLVGVTNDDYTISNIITKISTKAKYIETNETYLIPTEDETRYLTAYISRISYSGGVVGYLAGTGSVDNVSVKKTSLVSIASSAGFMFGFVGKDAVATNLDIEINTNMLIRATIYGGIIAGGSFGYMENVRIEGKQEESIILFSKEPYMAHAVGGVAGYVSGATINNVYIDQSLTMPYTAGLNHDTVDYVGGIVGVVGKENSAETIITKVNMKASISAIQTLGGIAGRTEVNTTLNMSEIAVQDVDLTLEGRATTPILGSIVGLSSGNVLLQNSYSKASLNINVFDYDEEIRLAIGELFGLAGVNEGATFSPNNIKLVENVFVQCNISISLIDKGVTEGGDQGNAQTFLYDIACKNVFNASELGPTDYLTFYKVDVGAPNEHRVDYAAQSSDLADMAAFGTAQLTNNFWKVIRDKEDAIIGAELTFIQNS